MYTARVEAWARVVPGKWTLFLQSVDKRLVTRKQLESARLPGACPSRVLLPEELLPNFPGRKPLSRVWLTKTKFVLEVAEQEYCYEHEDAQVTRLVEVRPLKQR
jgi:hypothetical protein